MLSSAYKSVYSVSSVQVSLSSEYVICVGADVIDVFKVVLKALQGDVACGIFVTLCLVSDVPEVFRTFASEIAESTLQLSVVISIS